MVNICHYTRYISLSLLESMDSEVLLKTIRMHGLRYGKTDTIHADFGTNFCGAKSDLEEKDSFDLDKMRQVKLELQSQGTELVQKSPKAPWVQGSAENAVKLCKKVISKKTTCSVFNWLRLLEFAEWTLNNRPLGVQSDLEVLTPNKYKPIHSNSHPSTPYKDYSAELTNAKERFHKHKL